MVRMTEHGSPGNFAVVLVAGLVVFTLCTGVDPAVGIGLLGFVVICIHYAFWGRHQRRQLAREYRAKADEEAEVDPAA